MRDIIPVILTHHDETKVLLSKLTGESPDTILCCSLKNGQWRCDTTGLDNVTQAIGMLERIKMELLFPDLEG